MARYRKIDVKIWNDEKFCALSDDGRLTFLFLLTHPSLTALGAMRATLTGLAAELGWSPKRLRVALAPALASGMIEVNERASYLGLPRFLRYNEPEAPNSVKAWRNALDLIPECDQKRALVRRCREYLDAKSPAFRDAMPDAIAEAPDEPSPMPALSRAPKLMLEPAAPPADNSTNGHRLWPDYKVFVELWNDSAPQECPRVRDLTPGRIQAIREALSQQPSMGYWSAAIGELRKSSFLRGLTKRPGHEHWRADFDWFLKSKDKTPNYVRVAEGAYRDGTARDEDDE